MAKGQQLKDSVNALILNAAAVTKLSDHDYKKHFLNYFPIFRRETHEKCPISPKTGKLRQMTMKTLKIPLYIPPSAAPGK